jgi:hypothetical protein
VSEAWIGASKLAGLGIVPADRGGEQAAAQRTVGNEPDLVFTSCGHEIPLGLAPEQRPFELDGGDRMHSAGICKLLGGDL